MNDLEIALRDLLGKAAHSLFEAYGVAARQVEASASEGEQLCGILGFTGNDVCGSVVVVAAPHAVASSNPVVGGSPQRWLAELTNQLVGRFKNDLYRRGVDVEMSIPVVLSAARLEPILQRTIAPIHLELEGAALSVWIEIEGNLTLQPPDESATAREGDALMF